MKDIRQEERGRGVGGYLQSQRNSRSRNKGWGRRGEREERCISPENMSYLRKGSGGQAGQREKTRAFFLLTTAKLSSTIHGHFSGTFLPFQAQKELAGGVVSLLPM